MKGFTLFTPLVGTAVIVTTILLTVSLLENDNRVSQTLSSSFEAASQQAAGRLIRAAATAQFADSMRISMESVLNGSASYYLTIQCSTQSDCESKAKAEIEKDAADYVLSGTSGAYSALTTAVRTASDYGLISGQEVDVHIQAALAALKPQNPFSFDWTDKLTMTMDDAKFAAQSSAFEADFKKGVTKIRVSMLPTAASVSLSKDVQQMLKQCANDAVSAAGGFVSCPFSYSCSTDYKLENGEGLAVAFCKA